MRTRHHRRGNATGAMMDIIPGTGDGSGRGRDLFDYVFQQDITALVPGPAAVCKT